MNLFGKKKDEKATELNSYTTPGNGGGYSYSAYNNEALGEIPRLSNQQNTTFKNNISQFQYDQQFTQQNTYNVKDPLLVNNSDSQQAQYHTVIDDGNIDGAAQSSNSENRYVAQIKEMMKMQGKSPLCKALTYINVVIVLLILYLLLRSF